jgi:RNA polymerase sigma-70 factor (ECF subfamily)
MRQAPDAEDVLQEAFTKAYIYLDKYSDRYRFYTWLATIVRNVALSHLKSRLAHYSLSEDLLIPSRLVVEDSPELAALASSRALVVRETVDALPERYRRVLLLRY